MLQSIEKVRCLVGHGLKLLEGLKDRFVVTRNLRVLLVLRVFVSWTVGNPLLHQKKSAWFENCSGWSQKEAAARSCHITWSLLGVWKGADVERCEKARLGLCLQHCTGLTELLQSTSLTSDNFATGSNKLVYR